MGGSGKGDPDTPACIQSEPENRGIITYRDYDHLSDGKSIKVVLGGQSFFPDWMQKNGEFRYKVLEYVIIEPRLPEFGMK